MSYLNHSQCGGRKRQKYGRDVCKTNIATARLDRWKKKEKQKENREQKRFGRYGMPLPKFTQSRASLFLCCWQKRNCPFFLKEDPRVKLSLLHNSF
jgi:hypothetical protein